MRQIWNLPGPDGKRWRLFSLIGGQLLRIDDALRFEPIAVPWPLGRTKRPAMRSPAALADTGEIWFATLHSGIYRWRDGRWTHYLATA